MAVHELAVLIGGRLAGIASQNPQTVFRYDDAYLAQDRPTPLSVSMPLTGGVFRQSVTLPWLDGVLPDSQDVRDRWAAKFGVSAQNPFALLAHMGRDCPGAVQFCRTDEADQVAAQTGELVAVTDAEIAARLDRLREDNSAWTVDGERWSLGGARAKFALAWADGAWHEAMGSQPTTHIIKPGIGKYRAHSLNEHYTMAAAGRLGLLAARTEYLEFDGRPAIVVERYDRLRSGGRVLRVHQEDLTQASSVPRQKKYEESGGPGAAAIVDLVRDHADEPDVLRFADALVFNFLIGGPDGHAKNYSFLLTGDQVRLAPLYDISSALPYDPARDDSALSKLAMAIGGERSFDRVTETNWTRFATRAGIDPGRLIDRVRELARRLPDALADVIRETPATDDQLEPRYLDRLARHLARLR